MFHIIDIIEDEQVPLPKHHEIIEYFCKVLSRVPHIRSVIQRKESSSFYISNGE